ncbi:MAG: ABC transporter ATP-binding protein [Methanosarcinaceae archaeon]
MKSINVIGVTKKYGDIIALDDISFTVPIGKICLITGSNGSGKTTFLNILLGLTKMTRGSIEIPENFTIGCSFQNPTCYENLTVFQNLSVFSSVKKLKDMAWIDYIIDFLSLSQWKNFYASDLSTGNAKKLDIALAMIGKPDVLILDEPLSTLDTNSRNSVIKLIEYLKECGTTVILTSHDISCLNSIIDKIIILNKGKVMYDNALPMIERKNIVVELKYENEKQNRNIVIHDKYSLLDEIKNIDMNTCSEIIIKKYGFDHLYTDLSVQQGKK